MVYTIFFLGCVFSPGWFTLSFVIRLVQFAVLQELGVSILQDLHRQRQTITHARDTLHGADDNIAQARRVLAGMSRRITANKAIMFAIIGLLVGAILLVLYFKIFR
jgi:vesicle transport through interaction with t-SNAREs protein 1